MSNIFSNNNNRDKEGSEQAVIVESTFETHEEYGVQDERDGLEELENELIKTVSSIGAEMDGHELGESTFTIYLYGENADKLYDTVKPVLLKSSFNLFEITKRYGSAQDTEAKEVKFSLR